VNEARLTVYRGALEYRFATPGWRQHRPEPLQRLLRRVRELDAPRCQRLVVAGDTPLRHPDFVPLAQEIKRLGFKNVALEIDAAPLARPGMVTLLGRLGFTQLAIVMGGLREDVHDRVLGEPGTLRAALEGLQRAVAAARTSGQQIYVVVPMLRDNAEDLEPLLDWIIGLPAGPQGFLLALPEIAAVPPPFRDSLLSYAAQARLAARVFRICQGHNIEYGFTTKRGILPCAGARELERFETVFYERVQYLQHTPHAGGDELVPVEACSRCSLTGSCGGVERTYLEHFGDGELEPVPLDVSMDWKLRRINKLEQFEYRNVSAFQNDSPVNPRGLIRINGHCNMSCAFCFVDRTVPDIALDELEREVDKMAREGIRHLVISGGEPTMNPRLLDYVRLAKAAGVRGIELQTNATRLDGALAGALVEAGVEQVTVSLHASTAEVSDTITGAPGTFVQTLRGLDALAPLPVRVQLNFVFCQANRDDF